MRLRRRFLLGRTQQFTPRQISHQKSFPGWMEIPTTHDGDLQAISTYRRGLRHRQQPETHQPAHRQLRAKACMFRDLQDSLRQSWNRHVYGGKPWRRRKPRYRKASVAHGSRHTGGKADGHRWKVGMVSIGLTFPLPVILDPTAMLVRSSFFFSLRVQHSFSPFPCRHYIRSDVSTVYCRSAFLHARPS